MDDLNTFCCQNPQCPDYGRRGLDNLRVCFRNGPQKQRRVLACRTCQKRFSQRKGTPL
jgi:LacI family transcriptional regulator